MSQDRKKDQPSENGKPEKSLLAEERTQLTEKIRFLESQIAEKDKRNDDLRHVTQDLNSANQSLTKANTELSKANQDLSQANEKLAAANEKLTELDPKKK